MKGLHITMFGPDGTNGVAEYAKRAHALAEEHEQILRGRDRRSGMISEVNVWKKVSGGGVFAGLAALGELIRRWFVGH
ncbi:MAG: hypothetical protein GWO15_03100 [Nitrosopumilaceae archaeon]|nr:hypothetical protein [Nitrosopumilaceae archaeon]